MQGAIRRLSPYGPVRRLSVERSGVAASDIDYAEPVARDLGPDQAIRAPTSGSEVYEEDLETLAH